MRVEAVIFDMDGLLFDTEGMGIEACQAAGEKQGMPIPRELVLATLGMTTERSANAYLSAHPGLDLVRFWNDYGELMLQFAGAGGPPLKPHARELIGWLRGQGIRLGLCSANQARLVDAYLDRSGLRGQFDAVVHGRPDLPSKPAPDMYLLTAGLLGAEPQRCLVLEDSPNGLQAGRAAGMQVIMVPDMLPFRDELRPYCDAVMGDLSQVRDYVQSA